MRSIKTDNSHLREKIHLRLSCIPEGEIRVLDAFGGKGVIWANISRTRNILLYTAIEKEAGKNPGALRGDNVKLLPVLDLSPYNVIDLDAYGMPIKQIEAVLNNRTIASGTVIFATCITSKRGGFPYDLATYINVTPKMINKCRTLFVKHQKDAIKSMLHKNGVEEWAYYEITGGMNKIYCSFVKI